MDGGEAKVETAVGDGFQLAVLHRDSGIGCM